MPCLCSIWLSTGSQAQFLRVSYVTVSDRLKSQAFYYAMLLYFLLKVTQIKRHFKESTYHSTEFLLSTFEFERQNIAGCFKENFCVQFSSKAKHNFFTFLSAYWIGAKIQMSSKQLQRQLVGLPLLLVVELSAAVVWRQILLQVVRGFIIYSTGYRERRNSLFLHMQGFQVSSKPSTLSQVISFLVRKSVPRTSGAVHMFLNECLAGKGNLDSSFFVGFCQLWALNCPHTSWDSFYNWTKISSLVINIFSLKMMVESGLEFILKLTEPLQSCCCPVQKDLSTRAELGQQVSRYL